MLLITLLCITEVDPKTALFSWKYIDGPHAFVDPFNISLPSFDKWEITGSGNNYDAESEYISLNGGGSAEIEHVFEVPSSQVYNFFIFQCINGKEQASNLATCTISILNDTIDIPLGNSYNYSSSLNINKASAKITLKNGGTSAVDFYFPVITLYRSPYYSDISFTRQYPVRGQTKAVFCELFLNLSIGKIELHTIHVNSPHRIPSAFNPHNQYFGGEGSTSFEFTTLPIISSETRIVGMNIFDSTLKLWRLYESDDKNEIGYCVDIDPVPPFRVTYIIIETSSINFPDSLEIWHNQFNNSFLFPDPSSNYGSIATPSSTSEFCVKSFYQKHMWGGDDIPDFPVMKKYLPMAKYTLTFPVEPDEILECAGNETYDFFEMCKQIKSFGIVTKDNKFSATENGDGNYTYNVIWSTQITTEYDSVNEFLQNNSYSGFAIDLSVAETMNYNLNLDDPQYFLIDNDGNRFKPAISSMYQLLYSYRNSGFNVNNILISDFFHPQFINVILTQGVVVNLVDEKTNRLRYDELTHNRLWRVRAQMGSCIFTILEQSDPSLLFQVSEDFFSICLTLGALPSFYYPHWSNCLYQDYVGRFQNLYNEWKDRFHLVLYNTTYFANGINMIEFSIKPELQIPPIPGLEDEVEDESSEKSNKKRKIGRSDSITYVDDEDEDEEANRSYVFGTISENHSFYEASTFCNREHTVDDGLIDCYEIILLGINVTLESPDDQISIQRVVTATFLNEQSPSCYFVSSPLTCTVKGQTVDVALNANITSSSPQTQIYRAAIISFKYRIGQSFEDWFRENFGAIIGSLIGILLLFIIMGFGFWFMYCRKKSDKGDLQRIMNREKEVRKEKRKKLLKLRNEQLKASKSTKENESFKTLSDS